MEKIKLDGAEETVPQPAAAAIGDAYIFATNENDDDDDSFLWSKMEELTAQVEAMQNDRAILTGFMDQLADEVIKKDKPNFTVINPITGASHDGECETFAHSPNVELGKDDEAKYREWMTFGKRFPSYQAAKGDDSIKHQQDTGTTLFADFDQEESIAKSKLHRKKSEASRDSALQAELLELSLRPGCMLLRAKARFQGSYDSDRFSPSLSRSHGGSSFNDEGEVGFDVKSDKLMIEWSEDQLTNGQQDIAEESCNSHAVPGMLDAGFFSRIKEKLKTPDDNDKIPLLQDGGGNGGGAG
jgi:hypothetical protein